MGNNLAVVSGETLELSSLFFWRSKRSCREKQKNSSCCLGQCPAFLECLSVCCLRDLADCKVAACVHYNSDFLLWVLNLYTGQGIALKPCPGRSRYTIMSIIFIRLEERLKEWILLFWGWVEGRRDNMPFQFKGKERLPEMKIKQLVPYPWHGIGC